MTWLHATPDHPSGYFKRHHAESQVSSINNSVPASVEMGINNN